MRLTLVVSLVSLVLIGCTKYQTAAPKAAADPFKADKILRGTYAQASDGTPVPADQATLDQGKGILAAVDTAIAKQPVEQPAPSVPAPSEAPATIEAPQTEVGAGEPSLEHLRAISGMWGGNYSYLYHASMAELHGALGFGFSTPGWRENYQHLYRAAAGRICRWHGYAGGTTVWIDPGPDNFRWPGYWDLKRNAILCTGAGWRDVTWRDVPLRYFGYVFGRSTPEPNCNGYSWTPWSWLVCNSAVSRIAASIWPQSGGRALLQETPPGDVAFLMFNGNVGDRRAYNLYGYAESQGVHNLQSAGVWLSFWAEVLASDQCRRMGDFAGGTVLELDAGSGAVNTHCYPYWH